MFGKNKILGIDNSNSLGVVNIFNTIQGEGPYAGMPAIFIRLGGCNLACSFCDTEFDKFENFSKEDILLIAMYLRINRNNNIAFIKKDQINIHQHLYKILDIAKNNFNINQILNFDTNQSGNIKEAIQFFKENSYLAVITGGEPMRYNIIPLVELLIANNFTVQIETNGTIYRELPAQAKIVYSPKCTSKIEHHKGYAEPNLKLLDQAIAIKVLISNNLKYYNDIPWWLQIDHLMQNDKNSQNENNSSNNLNIKLNSNYSYLKNQNILNYDQINQYLQKTILQPIDEYDKEKNKQNLNLAIELSFKYNVKLNLQLHKIINIE
ncbi:MAG: 7-carboxy-7-deazaguanine synthase QueE [Rickettsiales bacterium]